VKPRFGARMEVKMPQRLGRCGILAFRTAVEKGRPRKQC
jgi:hypothetical protein